MGTLSIVIPAYNERRTLLTILCRVLHTDLTALDLRKEILLIDDGSTDGAREIAEALAHDWRAVMEPALRRRGMDPEAAFRGVEFLTILQTRNLGKGAAVRAGVRASTGDYLIIQDADLEYDPEDYPRLLAPLLDGRADAVYGNRFQGEERRVLLFWHALGNGLLTTLSNMVNDLNLTDMETCYKAFRGDVIRTLKLTSDRFGFEPEVTAKLARMRYRIYEVPVRYAGRGYEAGKKITWRDGLLASWYIVKHRFTSDLVEGDALVGETLEKMSRLRGFNEHLFRSIRPFVGNKVLEAGSGHGNITEHLLGCADVVVTDHEEGPLDRLRSAFGAYDNATVARWDMRDPLPTEASGVAVNTIVCLNVLEHIDEEARALENARRIVSSTGGRLVLLVPAHPALFSPIDEKLGHCRRYTRASLQTALTRAGFEVEHLAWFNLLGLPGWWLNGRALGRDRLPTWQLGLFGIISRLWLPLERRIPLPVGLSLLAVGRAKGDGS